MHRIRRVRIADLRLHDDERNAIHEQHDVGDDALLHTAGSVDPELVDDMELVPLRMLEVDQLNDRILFPGDLIHIDLCLEQQRLDGFVRFQEAQIGLAHELVAQIVELSVGQPHRAVVRTIDRSNRLAEDIGQQPLPEARPKADRRIVRDDPVTVIDHGPIEGGELVKEWFLDVGVFAHAVASNDWRT